MAALLKQFWTPRNALQRIGKRILWSLKCVLTLNHSLLQCKLHITHNTILTVNIDKNNKFQIFRNVITKQKHQDGILSYKTIPNVSHKHHTRAISFFKRAIQKLLLIHLLLFLNFFFKK